MDTLNAGWLRRLGSWDHYTWPGRPRPAAVIHSSHWLAAALALLLSGCGELAYYGQAVSGQWRMFSLRQPVEALLADPATPAPLRRHLETARSIRHFASQELGLPDNGSYRDYADLGQPFVVWNVFAAPALSLDPKQWCFPILGCVVYRGYFQHDQAAALARKLGEQGWDIYLAGVPAYSTLGWFDDPLLNTFIHWSPGRLADLIVHELAHQRLYISDDTSFNESFATAVGELGAWRWLERHATPRDRADYALELDRRQALLDLAAAAREELATLYASNLDAASKHQGKARVLEALRDRYLTRWGGAGGFDAWFEDLNNAKLVALSAYHQFAPAFKTLFRQAEGDFTVFYRRAEALGALPRAERMAQLEALRDSVVAAATIRTDNPLKHISPTPGRH